MQRIGNASRYVRTRKTGITATENQMIQFAVDELTSALQKTNAFFNEKWKPYREEIEKQDVSPFKETKTFSLD